ncbi:3-hydroxybutyryl- dehydratase [Ilyonectria robusta]
MPWRDEWPCMANGEPYHGKHLLDMVRHGDSPFDDVWDVNLLISEVEEKLDTQVIDIPSIDKGSNNYGLHMVTSRTSAPDVVVRLARGDVNMPGFDGFPIEVQAPEARFEAAVYNLLRSQPDIRVSRLLYHRVPVQHPGPKVTVPQDLSGRRLFVFESAQGRNNIWEELSSANKLLLLDQLAHIRVALFRYDPPLDFAAEHFLKRLFKFKPETLAMRIAPTRAYWMHVFESKIKTTIRNEGDMIGWEDDDETVGPVALAAKRSLLRVIPHILPHEPSLYRLVLEHGDYGIHNMTIAVSAEGEPSVTSLYDWETGCIAPALLSDPLVAAGPVDLVTDANGRPAVTRIPERASQTDLEAYTGWAGQYINALYADTPEYKTAIWEGRHARHLWFALRDWRGGDSERFFSCLRAWAEKLIGTILLKY